MKTVNLSFVLLALLVISGCRWNQNETIYHPFADQMWDRFEKVSLEVPVKQSNHPVKVLFFARHTPDFPFRFLDFHMVMKTPSGEERINEYSLKIKDRNGQFLGSFQGDSCERVIPLKNELYINSDGVLRIEVENLTPRIKTPGLLGIGIRIVE